jgi:hypothetical protein
MDILRTGGDMRQPRTALFAGVSMWTLTPKILLAHFQRNNVSITPVIWRRQSPLISEYARHNSYKYESER